MDCRDRQCVAPVVSAIFFEIGRHAGGAQICDWSTRIRDGRIAIMLRQTVVPLHDARFQFDSKQQYFTFSPNLVLAAVPAWLRNDNFYLKRLSEVDRSGLERCEYCLIHEYEDSQRATAKSKETDPRPQTAIASDLVFLANLALWLRSLSPIGFSLMFNARQYGDTFVVESLTPHERFLYHPNDRDQNVVTPQDLLAAQRLYNSLSNLRRHSAPWTACRAVTAALQMQHNEIRHLLLWIALEALFGVESSGEIKYCVFR